MKKLTIAFVVLGIALIPSLLLAQPPRPRSGHVPYAQPHVVQTPARPTMQVHVPNRPMPAPVAHHNVHRPPMVHPPIHHPPVVQPRVVVVPQVVAPPVVAPYYPVYPGYYPAVNSGFSLTIGGRNGIFSISTAR